MGQDYNSMSKDDLVKVASQRGIDSTGTKEEIVNRLKLADNPNR